MIHVKEVLNFVVEKVELLLREVLRHQDLHQCKLQGTKATAVVNLFNAYLLVHLFNPFRPYRFLRVASF